MNVDIYIKEVSGGREIRVPILPEVIKYESGGITVANYDIMNKGEVAVPTGTGLAAISWSSEFPGKYQQNRSMQRGSWQDPKHYHSILEDWKKNGTPLNILVTGYPINLDVYLEDYTGEASGAFGDIVYELKFIENRNMIVTMPTSTAKKTATKRSTPETTSYTIKKGDTLWGIAEKKLGSGAKWETIYNANKNIIEQTAKKRGMSSSNHGWWIFPGVTISIPQ